MLLDQLGQILWMSCHYVTRSVIVPINRFFFLNRVYQKLRFISLKHCVRHSYTKYVTHDVALLCKSWFGLLICHWGSSSHRFCVEQILLQNCFFIYFVIKKSSKHEQIQIFLREYSKSFWLCKIYQHTISRQMIEVLLPYGCWIRTTATVFNLVDFVQFLNI